MGIGFPPVPGLKPSSHFRAFTLLGLDDFPGRLLGLRKAPPPLISLSLIRIALLWCSIISDMKAISKALPDEVSSAWAGDSEPFLASTF
jgi:hypothetical protein